MHRKGGFFPVRWVLQLNSSKHRQDSYFARLTTDDVRCSLSNTPWFHSQVLTAFADTMAMAPPSGGG
jgi:hypothetical protein